MSDGNGTSVFQKRSVRHMRRLLSTVSAVALSIAATNPVFAAGSNTSSPAPTPAQPAYVDTTNPANKSTVGAIPPTAADGCAWQYIPAINDLTDQALFKTQQGLDKTAAALDSDKAGLAIEATTLGVEAATAFARGGAFEAAGTFIDSIIFTPLAGPVFNTQGALEFLEAASLTLGVGGLTAQTTGVVLSQKAQEFNEQALMLSQQQAALNTYVTENLPLCDTKFTGTVTVTGGGVNVTGASIFQNPSDPSIALGVVGNVNASGNVTASMVQTTQGISAFGGAITIGDPGLTTYSSGITLGGGALSGAGTGGLQALTGDVSAIAIGNGAAALKANDTALGTGASATGGGSTALGANALASAMGAIAIGYSSATNTDAIAVGTGASASGAGGTAVGVGATAATGSVAIGNASATNTDAIAVGTGALASGVGSIAIGQGATATGSIAMGTGALASNGGAAYGDHSIATGTNSTAVGPGASATPAGSAAFGLGAAASHVNQQVFGKSSNTYTMPGVTSDLSRTRQSGPLELVTTDANGNLASDGGDVFKAIGKLQAGVAIALAAEAPSLTQSENFGMRIGWGNFDSDANGVAISAIGVVCRDCLTQGDRIAIDGSFGAGWSGFKTYDANEVVGGRAGVQWTWR